MPLITNMNVIGKRNPFSMDYEVGVNEKGGVQYLDATLYTDLGSEGGNENVAQFILHVFPNIYNKDPWDVTIYSTRSDCHNGTWCRAPGNFKNQPQFIKVLILLLILATTEAIAAAENIMEHIAVELNLDPVKVRLENMSQANPEVEKYITELTQWAEVDKRKKEIEEFNKVWTCARETFKCKTLKHKMIFRPIDGLKKVFLFFQCYILSIILDIGMC